MNMDEKINIIQEMNEDVLRKKVVIPLLSKLGFIDPIHNHHSNEKGKDIICKEYDQAFDKYKYIAVIVKNGNVTGAASGSDSYFSVINQIKQAINEPYKHIYEIKEVYIDQCILIASGKFLSTSLNSIYNTLKNERIDKAIRDAIDIGKLINLIDKWYGEFWDEYINEKEALIKQRNYLLNNISKLIKIIIPKYNEQEKALKLVSNSEIEIDLFPYTVTSQYIANIGYQKIAIDEIDSYFVDEIDNSYCDIKEYIVDLKKKAQNMLYQFDEVIMILKDILQEKNPLKICEYCEDLNPHVNGYGKISFDSKYLHQQGDFMSALEEYNQKKQILIDHNALELYKEITDDINDKCTKGLIQFLDKYPNSVRDMLLGYNVKYSIVDKKILSSNIYECQREIKTMQKKDPFMIDEYEFIQSIGDDEISVEVAVNYYGFNYENMKTEAKAKSLLCHFRTPVLNQLIEVLSKHCSSEETSRTNN